MRSQATIAATALALFGGVEAFWRMPCRSQTGIGRIDPIVDPGEVSAHVHTIHGGGGMGFDADYQSLTSSNCTSCEVTQDHSAYWTPALYFMYTNGTAVMVPQVGGMLAYYLYYLTNVTAFPAGFQMVAGDPSIRNFTGPVPDTPLSSWPTDPTDQFFLQQRSIGFNCLNYQAAPEPSLYRHTLPAKDFMDAQCTDGLRLEMAFPSCGTGALDSPDHKSHVAYPSLVKEGNCPDGYDVHYPFLFYETIWATNTFAGDDGQFMLSFGDPVGTGYHGDFMMGWESQEFLQNALDTCTNPSGEIQDCAIFDIQSDAEAAQCTFPIPDAIKDDNPKGPRNGLPVAIPIQNGPEPATPYPVVGRSSVPTSYESATPLTSTAVNPTFSYTAANPSVTSTAELGIIVAKVSHSSLPPSSTDSSSTSSTSSWSSISTSTSESSTITTPPTPSSSDSAGDAVTTSYSTSGYEVVELVIEQVEVTVTATPSPAAAAAKRHLHQHLHHAGRF